MDEYLMNKQRQISDAVQALYLMAAWEVAALPEEERMRQSGNASDIISGHADRLLYPQPAPKSSVREPSVLSALAWGVALLAYAEGGVILFERHYCIEPHEDCAGRKNGVAVPPPA